MVSTEKSRGIFNCAEALPMNSFTHLKLPPGAVVSHSGRRRVQRATVFLTGLLALLFFTNAARAQVSKEYQIKAAFLYNFTKFVEWPPSHFAATDSPIQIGLLGKNPFGDELEKIIKNRQVSGREFRIKTVTSLEEATSVDVLFVTAGEEKLFMNGRLSLQKAGVLTIGETKKFGDQGGLITFTVEAAKVRFEINLDTAEESGLKFSAQLLKLASVVRRKP